MSSQEFKMFNNRAKNMYGASRDYNKLMKVAATLLETLSDINTNGIGAVRGSQTYPYNPSGYYP